MADALEAGDLVYDKDRTANGAIGEMITLEELPAERVVQLLDGTCTVATIAYARNLRALVRGEGSVIKIG